MHNKSDKSMMEKHISETTITTMNDRQAIGLPIQQYKGTVLFHDQDVADSLENLSSMVGYLSETHREDYGLTLILTIIQDSLYAASQRINPQHRSAHPGRETNPETFAPHGGDGTGTD